MTEDSKKQADSNKGLQRLLDPFPEHQISLLPKPYKKDSDKGNCKECGGYHGLPAAHLKYVGHAALTSRLLEADINWKWEPMGLDENGLPKFDQSGGLWIKLTVCGQTRIGYGNAANSQSKEIGSREKEVIGDALRNAAMRFGAALDLWHKGDLHLEDETNSLQDTKVKEIETPLPGVSPASFKTIPNRASKSKEDPTIRFGQTYVGKKFSEVEPSKLKAMYNYAKTHPKAPLGASYIKDYESVFGEES